VILGSYHDGALARVQRVEFILPKAYPERIQTRTDRQNKFMLKELANGEYLLRAKVFLNDESNPVVLNRYITLWKDGPIL